MPLDNLRAFVDAIAAAGELARVERPVSVDKEVTEIADRCMKSPGGGPALLFRHPTLLHGGPSRYPVAVNLFGSARRMALALGVECLDDIGKRIATLLNLKIPDTLLGKLAMLPQLAEVAKFPPRTAGGRAPSQEVVRRDRGPSGRGSRARGAATPPRSTRRRRRSRPRSTSSCSRVS